MNDLALGLLGAVGVLIGLVGVLAPVVPGLLLVWSAAVATLVAQGQGTPWVALVLLSVLGIGGQAASLALPAQRMLGSGAPRSSLAVAGVGAVVGFFVVPVLGLLVGAVAGLLLAERGRTGDLAAAWESSRRVVAAYGLGVVVELLAGVAMGLTWLVAFVLRA